MAEWAVCVTQISGRSETAANGRLALSGVVLLFQSGNGRVVCQGGRNQMIQIKTVSKYLLAIFMIVAGMMHFVNPAFFIKAMPPYLPLHKELVLVSGVCEILLGILLLLRDISKNL